MGLETAPFVSSLVATNPPGTDLKTQGDDHLRLIKAALLATFPNSSKAFYLPDTTAKTADFTIAATDMNRTYPVSTAAGEVTATLPALAAGDAGWECHFIKTNTGTNALFIAPNSGTLNSGEATGLAKCRRVIPGHKSTAFWTGSAWYVSRVPRDPIGAIIEFSGAALPVGYEWPNGQTLANASTKYIEWYAVNSSSGVTPDLRGRASYGRDDMGGAAAGRLTATYSVTGTTLGAVGGSEHLTLIRTYLPNVQLDTQLNSGAITFTKDFSKFVTLPGGTGGANFLQIGGNSIGLDVSAVLTNLTGFTNYLSGGAASQVGTPIAPPMIVMNKILVVE